jgi:hypothetical protein
MSRSSLSKATAAYPQPAGRAKVSMTDGQAFANGFVRRGGARCRANAKAQRRPRSPC